ncbi:MAG: rubrerythrin family protein [Oscillospiraceae bacterium]|jgi:rubrerythrin|nr:rubrerythrin family protein [Oscillospiraceae bacterium]
MYNFSKSQTKLNLLKAFAGESQARNRYTFAASVAKNQGFQVIEKLFLFTANQEKEHAKIFYKFLEPFAGENIEIEKSNYPVDIFNSVSELLIKASKNEFDEYNLVYKTFGEIAHSEGFEQIAERFFKISEIEKIHGERFVKFSELIASEELFNSKTKMRWICLNCGNIFEGFKAPDECPVCEHPRGFYLKDEKFIFVK